MKDNQNIIKKPLVGEVVSDKMEKTVVVKTVRVLKHSRFRKMLRRVKKYKVHDEKGVARKGDMVEFVGGRPISKTKHMKLVRVLVSANSGSHKQGVV